MWDLVFSILKRKKKEKKGTAVNIYIFSSQQFAKQAKAMPTKVQSRGGQRSVSVQKSSIRMKPWVEKASPFPSDCVYGYVGCRFERISV
jgi:hypothetical protein